MFDQIKQEPGPSSLNMTAWSHWGCQAGGGSNNTTHSSDNQWTMHNVIETIHYLITLSLSLTHTSLSSRQIIKEKNNFLEFPEFVIKFSASEKIEYQVYLVLRLRKPPLCLCGSKTAPASPIKWFINPYYVNPSIFPFNLDIAPSSAPGIIPLSLVKFGPNARYPNIIPWLQHFWEIGCFYSLLLKC